MTFDVVVVGAGALGLSTAWHAARNGANVRVLDRGEPGQGTTRAGAGIVTRLLAHREDVGLVDRTIHWLEHLDDQHPDFTYHATDALLIVGPEHESKIQKLKRQWRAQALAVRPVSPSRIDELPGLEGLSLAKAEHAFLAEDDGYAEPEATVDAMMARAREHGAEFTFQCPVDRVEEGAVHRADGEIVEADAVVVAAGVRSREVFEDGWKPPIVPYRAQAARLSHEAPGSTICVHDAPKGTYWRPDGPARVVAGNGTDLSHHDPDQPVHADRTLGTELGQALGDRWPEIGETETESSWAGLAAGTPDTRPLVGEVPDRAGVSVCTGANGFGFMRAPALGEALAGQILGKGATVPINGCRPSRFAADHSTDFQPREGFTLE